MTVRKGEWSLLRTRDGSREEEEEEDRSLSIGHTLSILSGGVTGADKLCCKDSSFADDKREEEEEKGWS